VHRLSARGAIRGPRLARATMSAPLAVDVPRATAAADEATHHGLTVPAAHRSPGGLEFVHPVVRHALIESMTPARRALPAWARAGLGAGNRGGGGAPPPAPAAGLQRARALQRGGRAARRPARPTPRIHRRPTRGTAAGSDAFGSCCETEGATATSKIGTAGC